MSNGTITMTGAEYDALTDKIAALEAERAEQWRLRREAEAKVDTQAAVIAELQAELAELRAGQEPVVYVQPVSDHCDRITWRGQYYHLPIAPQPSAVPDVSAMAKVLSDRAADACNINRDDNWAMYGQEYIDDVQAMLEVARLNKGAGSHE